MFTGIIEEMGTVLSTNQGSQSVKLRIAAQGVLEDLKVGDSIATNGVCLTVTKLVGSAFEADVMPETIRRSNLRHLKPNSQVNLERAMRLSDRLGGHLVTGHVDGIAQLTEKYKEGNAEIFVFRFIKGLSEEDLDRYLIPKGSVAVDGISLTIVACHEQGFSVSVIPHTKETTVLAHRRLGDEVNIEVDVLGKYVEKFINREPSSPRKGLDATRLRELGY